MAITESTHTLFLRIFLYITTYILLYYLDITTVPINCATASYYSIFLALQNITNKCTVVLLFSAMNSNVSANAKKTLQSVDLMTYILIITNPYV
ncbi:hypothetical protein C8R41DRAFT_320554 [Lentinula lateritia]|uniref:Uncharacterized protein n=1 Tax=Lentinula lateritia TaxID=40482 RepID=A0ABQ8VLZ9_9AGAR|nr:hypothetical protein C8R41DRAFT_320554 [Lentinula lateritia]